MTLVHANTALPDEDTLRNVARDGEMDYAKWPGIIDALLERLNQIVFDEFPLPRPFPSLSAGAAVVATAPSSPVPQSQQEHGDGGRGGGHAHQSIETPDSQSTVTTASQPVEPVQPVQPPQAPTTPPRSLPPIPLFADSASTTPATHVPESVPPSQDGRHLGHSASQASPAELLPALLAQLLQSITTTLRATFSHRPPHTIQRLAELVLEPRRHYKTLPAWLRAVDRVVNVSSSADIFPLSNGPAPGTRVVANGVINGELAGGGILWKNDESRNGFAGGGDLGSDESLGGALLTPIPWLRHDDLAEVEAETEAEAEVNADADANISGNEDSGITDIHLELVRSHPSTDGGSYVKIAQDSSTEFIPLPGDASPGGGGGGDDDDDNDEGDALPHARGPQVVGAVDMGKVSGKEVELRITTDPDADPDPAKESQREEPEQKDTQQRTDISAMEIDDDDDDDDDRPVRQKNNTSTSTSTTRKHYEDEDLQEQQHHQHRPHEQRKKPKLSKNATSNSSGGNAEDKDAVFVGADGNMDDQPKAEIEAESEAEAVSEDQANSTAKPSTTTNTNTDTAAAAAAAATPASSGDGSNSNDNTKALDALR